MIEIAFLPRAKGGVLTILYKIFPFLNFRVPFLPCFTMIWSALCCLVEIGNQRKNVDTLATAIVNNKVSVISDPEV